VLKHVEPRRTRLHELQSTDEQEQRQREAHRPRDGRAAALHPQADAAG
jgi:hypothetical protein